MTIIINYTNKSGMSPKTIYDVKSYRSTSLWSIEITFNDGKQESFCAVESVKELSEPEIVIYELSTVFINDDNGQWDTVVLAYSKSIDKLKQHAMDLTKNIVNKQWINKEDFMELNIDDNEFSDSYIIKQITLI